MSTKNLGKQQTKMVEKKPLGLNMEAVKADAELSMTG
jgi:hypothetical protein